MLQVCKCRKNVFVQCELWCDEILRKVTRPCCSCSRHVSAQTMDTIPCLSSGVTLSLTQCPARTSRPRSRNERTSCPAMNPKCDSTASYLLYSTTHPQRAYSPTRQSTPSFSESLSPTTTNYPPISFHQPTYLSELIKEAEIRHNRDSMDLAEPTTESSSSRYLYDTSNPSNSSDTTPEKLIQTSESSVYWQTKTAMLTRICPDHQYLSTTNTPISSKALQLSRKQSLFKEKYSIGT